MSSLPYLGFWLFTILSGIISDKIIQKKVFSRTVVRKIFNTAGLAVFFLFFFFLKITQIFIKFSHLLIIGFIVPMFSVIGLIFVTCRVISPSINILFILYKNSLQYLYFLQGAIHRCAFHNSRPHI